MDSKTLIRMLEENGWKMVRVSGSHHTFKHPEFKDLVTVKHPQKDIPIGTLRKIQKDSGLR